jgi:hypothetical protein
VSIEQTDLVDIISIDRVTEEVTLTISDHLDWSDCAAHLMLLQSKLNRYLTLVTWSGDRIDLDILASLCSPSHLREAATLRRMKMSTMTQR